MGFFDSISRGWDITKASLKIISMDKELLILPILSGLLMLLILITFVIPIFYIPDNYSETYSWVFIFIAYLASFFLLYFSQAMIVVSARERLQGKNPTLGSSFSVAAKHIDKILVLSIIGAIIGVISSVLRGKSKQGGGGIGASILASLIGVAWTIASYFSIPIIINENKNAFESFGRSAELVSKAWGTGIAANASLIFLILPFVIFLFLGFATISLWPLALLLGILAILSLLGYLVIEPIAKGIISEVLYLYATTGQVPKLFPEEAVKHFYTGSKAA